MSENKNVFVTPKGRKYHFYTSCNYIKGRQYQKVSFTQAKKMTKGPCSSCQHLLEKNGDKLDDEIIQKEEEEEKEEKINTNINNEIKNKSKNNYIIKENKKISKNKNIEEHKENNNNSSSSSNSNSFEAEKDKITKENIINFFNSNFDEISGIKQNTNYNDNSKADIEIIKDKNDSKNKNQTKNKFDNDINNNKINYKRNINNNYNGEEEEDEEEEKKEDNNNNIINIQKEEYINNFNINNNANKNSIENMNKLKYNLDPNLPKKDLNWTGLDFFLLEETNKSSQLLFLQQINAVPSPLDKNILILTEKNLENKENSISKGNFKFRFEITPYKELKEKLKISVGFEIDYFEEENISLKKNDQKMILSYETLILIKHFLISKKTNKIHVMINISNGKFFVIGNDELEKRSKKIFLNSENSEILFLKNFKGIKLEYIKDVRPVFEYNVNYLKLVNIDVGRNTLNEYSNFDKNK